MDNVNDLLPLLLGIPALVLVGLGAVGLRRRGRTGGGTATPTAPSTTPRTPGGSTVLEDEPDVAAPPAAPSAPAAPTLERPEPVAGRLVRLRERLARSGTPLGSRLLTVLSRDHLTEDDWEEIEETLLLADVGAGPAMELVDRLRERVRVLGVRDTTTVRALLREQLLELVDPGMDRSLHLGEARSATVAGALVDPVGDGPDQDLATPDAADAVVPASATSAGPAVVLVVGVNGTGKTTTVGKLARVLVAEGRTVVLGAADTFRAAAADQLQTWGSRVGVPTVRSDRDGADPAAVAFDAVSRAREDGADVVLVDTAGRLQNKAGLMDELGKITRVLSRGGPIAEVLLVLDATTGQNGLSQARVFGEVAGVTGIVLTKLDGTAKGGIVVAVQRELGVPVKLVGLGEGPDDLAPFEPEAFVDGLLGG